MKVKDRVYLASQHLAQSNGESPVNIESINVLSVLVDEIVGYYIDKNNDNTYSPDNDTLATNNLKKADILIIGVSRTSKTPTSMYLAHRGYKVANYALVPNVPFPMHYLDDVNILIVGLTNDPKRLSLVRRTRQSSMKDDKNQNYIDIGQITNEVREARRLFMVNNWPVIDVTRRSVEETAAAIIQLHTNWSQSSK